MEGSETWRELLAEIISDSQERERVVQELNVNRITVARWINKETVPRLDNLRRLLDVVPEQRKRLLDLLMRDFPDLALHVEEIEPVYEVTSDFYASVLKTYVMTPTHMRFWSIGKMILQYLLAQLDYDMQHVAILLLKCQPPTSHLQVVRSLRSVMGVGTPPWHGNIDTQTILLGAESFVGQVLLFGYPALIENAEKYVGLWPHSKYSLPGYQLSMFNHEKERDASRDFQIRRMASEMAAPIVHIDKSAAILYVCSTRPGAFRSSHQHLLQKCAFLMTLAFAPEDFYARSEILLHMMPHPWVQGPLLMQVPQRILQLMRGTMNDQVPLDRTGAERIVWQQVEEELIQIASKYHENGGHDY
jgi:hypothetical protein